MDPRYRIVVGVDGSAAGERALRWAMRAAARNAGCVRAVIAWGHAADSGNSATDSGEAVELDERRILARQTLGAAVAAALNDNPRVRISTQIKAGEAGAILVESANNADLLVLGGRGQGTLDAGVGTVTEHCVRHARCPVVVVPSGDPAP